jgi:hypothetical protein
MGGMEDRDRGWRIGMGGGGYGRREEWRGWREDGRGGGPGWGVEDMGGGRMEGVEDWDGGVVKRGGMEVVWEDDWYVPFLFILCLPLRECVRMLESTWLACRRRRKGHDTRSSTTSPSW